MDAGVSEVSMVEDIASFTVTQQILVRKKLKKLGEIADIYSK